MSGDTLQYLPSRYATWQGHRQFLYYTTFEYSSINQIQDALALSRNNKLLWVTTMATDGIPMNVLQECMMATTATEFLQYHITQDVHIQFCFIQGPRLGVNINPQTGLCNNCNRTCTSPSDYVFCEKCNMPRGCTECANHRVHVQQDCNAAQNLVPQMLQYIKPMGTEPY